MNTELVSTLMPSACGYVFFVDKGGITSALGYMNLYYSQIVVTVRIDETVPINTVFPCYFILYKNREYCHITGCVYSWLMVRFLHGRLKT
jgi:hypothetical protein